MTAQPTAPPLPRPVHLYEGPQGELYLSRDGVAYPVSGNWPERHAALNGLGSLFGLDALAWNRNPIPLDDPGVPDARKVAKMLDASAISTDAPNQYRRLATWHPDGRVELHRRDLRKGSYAYLGNAVPAFRAKQPATMTVESSTAAVPKRAPATPDEATPYDGFPKGYQRQPEVEVRIAFDVLLGLYRDQNTTVLDEGGWMLAATDSAGRFLTSWGKGTGDVPAAVWHLAAEAAHRHHLDKHGSL